MTLIAASAPADALVFVGIDVSKARLDVCLSDDPRAPIWVDNDSAGVATLVRRLRERDRVALVALEATGGYERIVLHGLLDAGLPAVRVNPLHARRSPRCTGERGQAGSDASKNNSPGFRRASCV